MSIVLFFSVFVLSLGEFCLRVCVCCYFVCVFRPDSASVLKNNPGPVQLVRIQQSNYGPQSPCLPTQPPPHRCSLPPTPPGNVLAAAKSSRGLKHAGEFPTHALITDGEICRLLCLCVRGSQRDEGPLSARDLSSLDL